MKNVFLGLVVLFSSISFGYDRLSPDDVAELTKILEQTRQQCLAASGEDRRKCWVGYNALLNTLRREGVSVNQFDGPSK